MATQIDLMRAVCGMRVRFSAPCNSAPGARVEGIRGTEPVIGGPAGRSSRMEVDMRVTAKGATARERFRFLGSVRFRFEGRRPRKAHVPGHRPRPPHPPATASDPRTRRRRIIGYIWVAAALVLLTAGLLILTIFYAESGRSLRGGRE